MDYTSKEIQEETNAAIERGMENAQAEWRAMALSKIREVCLSLQEFTVNDVRDAVRNSPLKTHDNRAMGGVMKTAQKMGMLEPTGQSIPSLVGHRTHIQIWRSKLFKGNQNV